MSLPAPNLDDRRFQDLVDDAKRYVQQRCPEWTDHNVSDPGVTLIELFAQMTDQLVYRLNRVPDRNYVKFLDLIGVNRFPPSPAKVPVTFWLAAIPTELRLIRTGTEVATRRTEREEAVEFTTVEDLAIVPVAVQSVRSSIEPDRTRSHDDDMVKRSGFSCFGVPPKADDVLYIGLSEAAPGNVLVLTIKCTIEGIGVDPTNPPLVWEAWTGDDWEACEMERDSTGGLNRDGEIVLHLPRGHATSIIARQRAGWVRARVTPVAELQPVYSHSPLVTDIRAHTIGGTAEVIHARIVDKEVLGISDGSAGQRFQVERRPIVRHPDTFLEVSEGEGPESGASDANAADGEGSATNRWERWTEVPHFADSGPLDRHYQVNGVDGEILFGPTVRLEDGTLRSFGATPPKGATLQLRGLAVGGGLIGNVNRLAISILMTSIPGVARIENRRSGIGGRDAESLENAKLRGPLLLRTRGRAVTVEDFEELAREAAPDVARVRCVPAGIDGVGAGAVRVLVVPDVPTEAGRIRFEQLLPGEESLRRITESLDRRRLIGTRISVEPPVYQGVTVVARVRCRADQSPTRLQEQAVTALYRYFSPTEGGPQGTGWPFGRPLLLGEVYAVLQRLPGLELVEDARLFGADPISGQRGQATPRIDIASNALVFSYDHQVLVEAAASLPGQVT